MQDFPHSACLAWLPLSLWLFQEGRVFSERSLTTDAYFYVEASLFLAGHRWSKDNLQNFTIFPNLSKRNSEYPLANQDIFGIVIIDWTVINLNSHPSQRIYDRGVDLLLKGLIKVWIASTMGYLSLDPQIGNSHNRIRFNSVIELLEVNSLQNGNQQLSQSTKFRPRLPSLVMIVCHFNFAQKSNQIDFVLHS